MLDTWINSVDGYILVYSIDDKDSFNSTRMRYERIVKNKGRSNYSMIIVGNKCDLEAQRAVSREEAEKYCMGLGVNFLETSALMKIYVKECFLCVAKGLLKQKFPEKYNEDQIVSKKKCYCF